MNFQKSLDRVRNKRYNSPISLFWLCEEVFMSQEPIPFGQRMLGKPLWLLLAGIVVMFVFYTAWGLYEIWSLPWGALP